MLLSGGVELHVFPGHSMELDEHKYILEEADTLINIHQGPFAYIVSVFITLRCNVIKKYLRSSIPKVYSRETRASPYIIFD